MTGLTRTAGRNFAKIAVTAAVVGGTSIALSGTANAATDAEWDRVAQCESGGDWSINTGNGYQGGLQFAPSTWSGYGGDEFAPSANQASKAEQIVVAERVLAGQGKGAWPVCGVGLSGPTERTAPSAPAEKAPVPNADAIADIVENTVNPDDQALLLAELVELAEDNEVDLGEDLQAVIADGIAQLTAEGIDAGALTDYVKLASTFLG